MPVNRPLALTLLNFALAVSASASLLIRLAWRGESWANYTSGALIFVCLGLVLWLYRLRERGFAAISSLSPNWRRVAIGVLIILAVLPWSLIVGLGVHYGILPNNVTTGLILSVPLAGFVITGAYILIRGSTGRR